MAALIALGGCDAGEPYHGAVNYEMRVDENFSITGRTTVTGRDAAHCTDNLDAALELIRQRLPPGFEPHQPRIRVEACSKRE